MGTYGSKMHVSKRGLNLPIAGEPAQKIHPGPPIASVAVVAVDYIGMRPRMRIQVGDEVKRGQVLFEDRKTPGVLFTAPGAGTVQAIHRGERRALLSVVIALSDAEKNGGEATEEVAYESFTGKDPAGLSSDEVKAALIECGLWTALRTRPFSKVPTVDSTPKAIFVTAADTNPLAPDPAVVLAENRTSFEVGLSILAKLPESGKVYLCKGADAAISAGASGGVEVHAFKGPHPAGNAGFHIHTIAPAERDRVMWHVGYQDVVAIGHFFTKGKLYVDRVIALAGPQATNPRLIKTRLGAATDTLVSGETRDGDNRVVSGSVLNGRAAIGQEMGYLGRYHNQITIVEEGNKRRFLGWMRPGFDTFSVLRLFGATLTPGKKFNFDTDLNGGLRGIVPVGAYEKVMPFDMMPTFLLRSLVANDMEKAEELGVLELDEEDVALCTFVCPSKNEYGVQLRSMLTRIEKEG